MTAHVPYLWGMTFILRYQADLVEKGTRKIVGDPIFTQWTEVHNSYEDASKSLDERVREFRGGIALEGTKEVATSSRTIIPL